MLKVDGKTMNNKDKGYLRRVYDKTVSRQKTVLGDVFKELQNIYTYKDGATSEFFGGGSEGRDRAVFYSTLAYPVALPFFYFTVSLVALSIDVVDAKKELGEDRRDRHNIM